MNPHEKLRAFALVRAAIEDDGESIAFLMQPPPSGCILQQLVQIAASSLEQGLGTEKAIETIDLWLKMTLAEMVVEEQAT